MKSQALIVQFMVFFSIGLLVFSVVSNVFPSMEKVVKSQIYYQRGTIIRNFFEGSIVFLSTLLRNSSYSFTLVDGPSKSFVQPNNYWIITKLTNRPDFYISFGDYGFKIELPDNSKYESTAYNYNYTLNFTNTKLGSDFKIVISYNPTNNILVVDNA